MLTAKQFETIRLQILNKLENDLSSDLFYHSVHHTIDVETQAKKIALSESLTDEHELLLLRLACLYHDSGFLFTYNNEHEAEGCRFMTRELQAYPEISSEDLTKMCEMIDATKVPQMPKTKLEEIIADADLDYLGRDDFFEISNYLFLELKAKKIVTNENDWNLIQVKFFKQHKYFTPTAIKLREQKKQQHLKIIESMVLV